MSLNLFQCIGRVVKDPEYMEFAREGKPKTRMARFTLAVTRFWRDVDNHKTSKTEFIDFVAWAGTAAIARKFLRKGARVYASGKFEHDRWVDKVTGQKRKRAIINLYKLIFLDKASTTATEQQEAEQDDEFVDLDEEENADGDVSTRPAVPESAS